MVALVDDEDYEELARYKWYASHSNGNTYYAARRARVDGGTKIIFMHSVITGYKMTDHKNLNKLDCRRENMRECTKAQNEMNKNVRSDNKVGFKGVSADNGRFRAQITISGKAKFLGLFDTAIEAAKTYDKKAREIFGEFARTNHDMRNDDNDQSRKFSDPKPSLIQRGRQIIDSTYDHSDGAKYIPLTKRYVAIVDAEDYDDIMQYKWCASVSGDAVYAIRKSLIDGKWEAIAMHYYLTGFDITDHIDGNGINNRRSNLRSATKSQNQANSAMRQANTSGYKGVTINNRGKIVAQIGHGGNKYFIGHFKTTRDAAIAYDKRAVELFGEFAKTNKMLGLLD